MDKKGFTLIELMVVLAVIAILVGVAIPRFKGMQDEANQSKAKMELKTIQAALESYYINQDPHAYPASSTTLISTYISGSTPSIIEETIYDPFISSSSTEYRYYRSSNGKYYIVFSAGINGTAEITGIADSGVAAGTLQDDIFVTNGTGPSS